jgi:MscS family membrane protein
MRLPVIKLQFIPSDDILFNSIFLKEKFLMNDFLDRIWGNNSVKSYLIVAGLILFVFILKRYISRYFAALLHKAVHKIWKDVDRSSFINLIFQPIGLFLLILVSILSLHKLNFPPKLNIDLYGYSSKQILHCIGTIVLIISFIWLLLRIIDFVAMILERKANLTPDMSDNQLVVFFRDFFKVLVVIVGIMMMLSFAFRLNVGSLITGLSIIGAAIALALRESLENLIASFVIFFDKPFITGDLIKVKDITGTVEKIGLRSTRIRSDYKTWVSVPNKQMVDSVLDNLSLRTQRRGDLVLKIDVKTPVEKLKGCIEEINKILASKNMVEYNVHFTELSACAAVLVSDYYTLPVTINQFNEIRQEIHLQILQMLNDMQIEVAGKTADVRIVKGD